MTIATKSLDQLSIDNTPAPPVPPVVTQVFVSGSAWTPAYKSYLQAQGLGDATFGYTVPGGAAQLNVLPWGNINQVSIRFDQDVATNLGQELAKGPRQPELPGLNL